MPPEGRAKATDNDARGSFAIDVAWSKVQQNRGMALGEFKDWHWNVDADSIAWLRADRAGETLNSLSERVLDELAQIVDQIEVARPAGLVILSDKPSGFIAGADVREFDHIRTAVEAEARIREVHALFARIENLRCATVAAIHGYCLGGGLELALTCDYRIALDVPSTRIGFPEIKLGIFPGFGGSARSVRLLGGRRALEVMLTGRMLSARQARSIGLIDDLVFRHRSLRWSARSAVLAGRRSRGAGRIEQLTNLTPARAVLAPIMLRHTAAKVRSEHYPAPFQLIELWRERGGDPAGMLDGEARRVGKLLVGTTSNNLRRVFRLMERLKAFAKPSDDARPFRPQRLHVVGAGVMGGDIAAWCAYRGMEVTLQDREMRLIQPALDRAGKLFQRLGTPQAIAAAHSRLIADPGGRGAARADVVVEAIFEDLNAKRELFRTLEPRVGEQAVLATNTSAIPLESIAEGLAEPGRLIGLHFFNPVAKMPLVEVVRGRNTDPEQIGRGCAFAAQIEKLPLPVRSAPGFLVNRVLAAYLREAFAAHREGVPIEALDRAATEFGMPMGPVELADSVGLDICLNVVGELGTDDGGSARELLQSLVDAGHLGKKTGKGFYDWQDGRPMRKANTNPGDSELLSKRLIDAYLSECRSALADGVVEEADLLDAGMIFGTGFPPFLGGPLNYANTHPRATDNSEAA